MNDPCSDLRARFPEHLYGETSHAERREIERHVEACLPCREELDALRATTDALDRWEVTPVARDARAVAEAVRGPRPAPLGTTRDRSRLTRRFLGLAAAAGLVFLCALGSDVRIAGGELVLRLRLPWNAAPAEEPLVAVDEIRARWIAREELARHSIEEAAFFDDYSSAQERERVRLLRALDLARDADRRLFVDLVDSLASRNVQENERMRDALVELASIVTDPEIYPRPDPRLDAR